ncbi:MAG: VWA domain-containing protein [Bacteroidales bacterium]|nr:VWA domain-containing protein [Bacteroidales bacterium]
MRRLPVYLLLDISGSMRGEPINAVNCGIKTLVDTLKSDPYALETAFLSLITFNKEIQQSIPLTEIYAFQTPELEAKLGTYLGKALKYVSKQAENEIVKTTIETKGDWKPLLFIMSDGKSGDKVEKALTEFNKGLFGCIVACAPCRDSNIEELRKITKNIVQLDNLDKDAIGQFFQWVSASVATSSVKVNSNEEISQLEQLPKLPSKINLVKN